MEPGRRKLRKVLVMRIIPAAICIAMALASCGPTAGNSAASSPTSLPPAQSTGPGPTVTCPKLASRALASSGYVLDAAALLSAIITVSPMLAAQPKCIALDPGGSVYLDIGDQVEFIANQAPALTPDPNPIFSESASPGPSGTGPGGGPRTSHVIVTLTAKGPGTTTVRWIDCSGTAC